MDMLASYKFRMYPNSTQEKELVRHLGICRSVYNDLLSEISDRKAKDLKVNKTLTQDLLPQWKKTNPELKRIYSKVLQMVNYQIRSNIKGLAISKQNGNRIGRLRYKTSRNSMKTLNYNQSGFDIDEESNKIRFSKIGWIRTIIHRPIPDDGKVKGIIIKRTSTDKWFAMVQIEMEFDNLPETGRDIGLDMGISSFVTDSDKTRFEYPNNIDRTLDKIKKYQRILSKKTKRSNNYCNTKNKLKKIYERLNNQRRDFLHKLSTYYIRNYDRIAIEDLNIAGMVQQKQHYGSRSMNRHILDASWSKFFDMLDYKAERAGRKVQRINPKGTSKRCSVCSEEVDKELSDRLHSCPSCGYEADRDYNASLNILYIAYHRQTDDRSQGLASLPVEDNPLLASISASEVVAGKIFC